MKYLLVGTAISFLLNSCNTTIGLYRDTKQGFIWTKNKIQGASQSPESTDDAPVY
jgi:predicted small secreted protein